MSFAEFGSPYWSPFVIVIFGGQPMSEFVVADGRDRRTLLITDLYEYLASVAKTNGFDPESATLVNKWAVIDKSHRSELVEAEEALLRTSWVQYRR